MAEVLLEKRMKIIGVTVVCFAVMTAIAAALGAACGARQQFLTAIEASKWAYYQAKSIKQNLFEVQKNAFEVEMLGAATLEQKALYDEKLKAVTLEISRYDSEKNQIKDEAEDTANKNKLLTRKGNLFSASVVLFLIGIMLTSLSALISKKFIWITGFIFGLIATVFLAYGLFLHPLLF